MNKKSIFGIGALMAVMACSVAFAVAPNKTAKVEATSPNSYMARFYNDFDLEFPYASASDSGFKTLKASGANKAVPVWAKGSSLTWTISYGNYSYKDDSTDKCALQLGTYQTKSDDNDVKVAGRSLKSANYDGTVFRDITNGFDADESVELETYSVAMVSNDYISNIQDVAFFWNNLTEIYGESGEHATSYARIVYLVEGETTWKVLKRDDGYSSYALNVASGTGVANEWNAYAAFAGDYLGGEPSNEGDFAQNLKGKTAKLAIVFSTNNYHVNFYYYLSGIIINRANAIKSFVDYLDDKNWVCRDLHKTGLYCNYVMKMGGYKMTQTQADALNVAHSTASGGKEPTYYRQFAYLYNRVMSADLPVAPSSSIGFVNGLAKTADGTVLVVASLTAVALVSVAILILNKKKKHN